MKNLYFLLPALLLFLACESDMNASRQYGAGRIGLEVQKKLLRTDDSTRIEVRAASSEDTGISILWEVENGNFREYDSHIIYKL